MRRGDTRGGGRRRPDESASDRRGSDPAPPESQRPLPYRVVRWGRFWALEPLFADARTCLVAKGGPPPKLDEVVLALPSHGDRRRIVEVLGAADDLRVVLRALLHAKGVRQGFSPEVLDEAEALRERADQPDDGRRDLVGLPTFTIDPDTARDFDDAISVTREAIGYRVHVHIADVSYFVDLGGEIEREARRRTSSLYVPLFAEPMLPAALSNDICSLMPRRPRKCLTVELTFDAEGRRTGAACYRSLISSDHRLTYGFVDTVIGPAPPAPRSPKPPVDVPDATTEADEELRAQLLLAAEIAGVLRRRRMARGALAIGSFEPEFSFDEAGAPSGAAARPETPSHALVEEFMLAANEAVAEYLLRKQAHTLYRVHEPPDPQSVREVLDQFEELDVPTPAFPEAHVVPPAQLQEAYGRLSRLVAQTSAREGRGRLAWSILILRSLKQARYSPANLGHFGLAAPAYLHFTSPIRRYPDLVTHRSLLAHLGEGGAELDEAELAAAAEDCSKRERDFARIELIGDDLVLCTLLERRLEAGGWEQTFAGEIIGLVGGGLFVRFGKVFEGFLPSRRLGAGRLEVSEHETALVGEASGACFRLGDAIEVKVERVDRLSGKVDLAPVEEAGGSAAGPGRRPAAGRGPTRRPSDRRRTQRRAPGRDARRRPY